MRNDSLAGVATDFIPRHRRLHSDQACQDSSPTELPFAGKALGAREDAMIGFDFLGKGPFSIDYQFKKIVFGPIMQGL
jgi:hypothetical protein